MICGTSTGGIITLALASGKSINEIIDTYEKNAKYLFPYYHESCFYKSCLYKLCHYYKTIKGCTYDND